MLPPPAAVLEENYHLGSDFSELDAAMESLDAVIEGANTDTKNILYSDEVKKAKSDMQKAYQLMTRNKFKDAIPLLDKAISTFKKARREVSSITSWPLASAISGFIAFFDAWAQAINANKEEPYLGNTPYNMAMYPASLIRSYAMLGFDKVVTGGGLGAFIRNKLKGSPDKGTKGGFFNNMQRNALYILDAYIDAAEIMLKDARNGYCAPDKSSTTVNIY